MDNCRESTLLVPVNLQARSMKLWREPQFPVFPPRARQNLQHNPDFGVIGIKSYLTSKARGQAGGIEGFLASTDISVVSSKLGIDLGRKEASGRRLYRLPPI